MDETTTTTTVDICWEDEPCWDCSTMGNQICGPVNVGTALVIERPEPAPEALARTGTEANLALIGLALVLVGLALVRVGGAVVLWAMRRRTAAAERDLLNALRFEALSDL